MTDSVSTDTGHKDLRDFMHSLSDVMERVDTQTFREDTFERRVSRRFTKREVAAFLGVDVTFLAHAAKADTELFPTGKRSGREVTFSADEVGIIRALLGSKPRIKPAHIHWRKPGDPLKVIAFGALKGGTGKTLSSAHFAQYLALAYGLRVGVIDSDPQATCSLYFAGDGMDVFTETSRTAIDFMGLSALDGKPPALPPAAEQNDIWQQTPWPGVRMIPGGMDIMNGDMALMRMYQSGNNRIYAALSEAIDHWSKAHQPKAIATDLRNDDGTFNLDKYRTALTETLDVIVIDQQPSMTFMQMCGTVSADSLVVPMTMKGFDLSTLSVYAESLASYLDVISEADPSFKFGSGDHFVLPSIVQGDNEKDVHQIADLRAHGGDMVAQVWYDRSAAVANASEQYMSIYEYTPPDGRKVSAKNFTDNANAVNDYIVSRALPHLPDRGFGAQFISDRWGE
ncbi:ParA family protein [Pseudophaeobacter leonis]|uniref:ParA family protein n=1 Tax=Pseudophaeobacter leonis TaxID=1144477 RepID=UPI00111C70DC|nr:AAA family ATPase [Pseudophaeobacter leonis]